MFKKPYHDGKAGLKNSGPLAIISKDGLPPIPAQKHTEKTAGKKPEGRWLFGMMAGQVAFFALTLRVLPLFMLPPAAVLPVLFSTTLTGGLLGGFVHARLTRKTPAAAPSQMRTYIFQALVETNRKLAEMFVDEDFNAAANNNTDRRKMKAKPELKVAPPVAPRMGGM